MAADTSEQAATSLCERIREKMRPLCLFPDAGAPRPEIFEGLRATFLGRYVIYYVHDEVSLIIVRVLHGARDAAAIIADGDSKV